MMSNGELARENIQDELLRSTATLRALPDGVVICDRAGIIRFINPAGARLLQIDADAWITQSIANLPGGIVLPTQLSEQGHEQLIAIEYQDQRCNIMPIWSEGCKPTQIGFLITIKPVYLETLSLEELRTLIAYELRGPLTTIMGGTEIVLRGLGGELSQQQRDILQIVNDQGKKLTGIVNNLVAIIGLDSGNMRVFIDEENISEIVHEVVDSKKKLISERAITCEVKVSSDPLNARVDRSKLYEILSHLLENACRYTPAGGNISVDVKIDAAQLRCDVHDTGIGISDNVQSRVFVGQVNDYGHPLRDKIDNYSGSGLGLIITKRLIDLHGGRIWFQSTVGQGSTFSFVLPISDPV
jgi:signal transduction histidine kinase